MWRCGRAHRSSVRRYSSHSPLRWPVSLPKATRRIPTLITIRRCRRMSALLIVLVVSSDWRSAQAFASRRRLPRACEVIIGPSERITLSDGASVTVDASSIASRGRSVLITGTPTHVWPAGANGSTSPDDDRRPIGVLRDSAGVIRLVPAPLPGTDALYPRAVAAGAAGWHVIFITGKQGTATNPLAFDTADVWYGLFDGRQWRRVERVARTRAASLLPSISSDLVAIRDGLAFAYAFDRSASLHSNAAGNQGLVLLYRRGIRWAADTLFTWESPLSVQLATTPDSAVIAVFASSYFSEGRPHGPVLFTARHDAHWETPRVVFDASPRYVTDPMVAGPWAAGTVVSWRTVTPSVELEVEDLEWGFVAADGAVRRIGRIATAQPLDRPAMLQLDTERTVWFVRNGASRRELRVFVTSDSTVSDLGIVHVPLDNFVTRGTTLSNGTILVLTGGVAASPSDPPASSFLTELAVRCPSMRE